MAAHRKVDYDRIEPDWRAGIKSIPQLAAEYTKATGVSVSHVAIFTHFKRMGIPRDLGAKVKAKADALLMKSMLKKDGSSGATPKDAQIIDEAANVVAGVQIKHRKDIGKAQALMMRLFDELEVTTNESELLGRLREIVLIEKGKDVQKAKDVYDKLMNLGPRIDMMKRLTECMRNLTSLEREAFGLTNAAITPEGNSPSGLTHFYGDSQE